MAGRTRTPAHARLVVVALLAVAASATAAPAQTILNVERLQPEEVAGWHWGVEGDLSVARGNSDFVELLAGVAVGHRWSGDWLRLFTGVEYHTEDGVRTDWDRYLHARYNHWLGARWQTFHFVQLQASQASLLRRRILVGSGLRHRLVDGTTTLDVGTGVMWESEELDGARVTDDHPVEARVWRMANLIVARRPLTDAVRVVAVGYVQPDLEAFEDVRILADVSVLISLTENLDLTVRNEWRHDSRPPGGVEHDDWRLSTGFAVSFR